MTEHPVTIHVVDDDVAVRDALAMLIGHEGFTVKTYPGGEEFLAAGRPDGPECVECAIVDLRMAGMGGLQLQQEMSARGIRMPILFLTGHGDIPSSVKAIKAGAVDFLTKPIRRAALIESIQGALEEARRMSQRALSSREAESRWASLTLRERQTALLALKGLSNKEIGKRMNISHRTVEIHRARVLEKTAASSILDLARLATEAGFAPPPDEE